MLQLKKPLQKNLLKFLSLSRALLMLVVLNACGKQPAKDIVKAKEMRLGHAQHFDIPTPVTFKNVTQSANKDPNGTIHDFIQCTGNLPIGATIAFYKQEMERMGWEINDLSGFHEGFIYCTKPNKHCGIQIRSTMPPTPNKPTTICLFITSMV